MLREDRRLGRSAGSKRGLLTTFVAAVEDAPAETAPSTSSQEQQQQEQQDEFAGAMDFTNADELYKRFNELLEQSNREIQLHDKVVGTIAR